MRRYYYWLVTQDPNTGKPYLIYGGEDEISARQQGLEMLGGLDFEIRKFPTRDLATASSYLKGKRLKDTQSLTKASERLGHNKSLKQFMRQRLAQGD